MYWYDYAAFQFGLVFFEGLILGVLLQFLAGSFLRHAKLQKKRKCKRDKELQFLNDAELILADRMFSGETGRPSRSGDIDEICWESEFQPLSVVKNARSA